MLTLTEIKTGKKILFHEDPHLVLEYQHSKTGPQRAVLRTKLKNLLNGAIIDYTFKGAESVEEAEVTKSKAQYLYHGGDEFTFMDMETFDQFALSRDILGTMADYLVEGTEVTMLNWNNRPLNIELPVKMTFTVAEAPPGIKGDTASGGDKVVILETGMTLTTPLFIKTGDKVIVNTEKGAYVSRA